MSKTKNKSILLKLDALIGREVGKQCLLWVQKVRGSILITGFWDPLFSVHADRNINVTTYISGVWGGGGMEGDMDVVSDVQSLKVLTSTVPSPPLQTVIFHSIMINE